MPGDLWEVSRNGMHKTIVRPYVGACGKYCNLSQNKISRRHCDVLSGRQIGRYL
ncbi:hypothetical protein SERLADRAFT_390353, partial [Serpula lacrymans var. lacrymans S7.9]